MSAIESRISAGHKQRKRGGFGPLEGQPIINGYSPARRAACHALGIPYGQVYVGGVPSHIRSHEIRLDSRDGSCYIIPEQLAQHREEREADAAWFAASQSSNTATASTQSHGAAA